jgi:hypothetical protein
MLVKPGSRNDVNQMKLDPGFWSAAHAITRGLNFDLQCPVLSQRARLQTDYVSLTGIQIINERSRRSK